MIRKTLVCDACKLPQKPTARLFSIAIEHRVNRAFRMRRRRAVRAVFFREVDICTACSKKPILIAKLLEESREGEY